MSPKEIGKWVRREQVTSPEFEQELVSKIKALVGEYEAPLDNSKQNEDRFEQLQRALQRERDYALRLEAQLKEKNVDYMKLYKRFVNIKSHAEKSASNKQELDKIINSPGKYISPETVFDVEYNSRMKNSVVDNFKRTQPQLYRVIIAAMKKHILKMPP